VIGALLQRKRNITLVNATKSCPFFFHRALGKI